ncbi:MAG: hypothetical protein AAB065_02385, partial [Deltaproteobacteria bacterium]
MNRVNHSPGDDRRNPCPGAENGHGQRQAHPHPVLQNPGKYRTKESSEGRKRGQADDQRDHLAERPLLSLLILRHLLKKIDGPAGFLNRVRLLPERRGGGAVLDDVLVKLFDL